ncbi:MAG: AAA family ATPase [Niameybacter sp.]|uniref:AAA family ATPase n=1 Tax=Niameybacter sp. TaxID=2033640 RepID=UPI002FCC8F83
MGIKQIKLQNFTVFQDIDLQFSKGINIFIGENGTGKTHIMKVLYSACQAVKPNVSFSHKVVRVFKPDSLCIGRLVRRKVGNGECKLQVYSDTSAIIMSFSNKTKKWDAHIKGEEKWEKQMEDLTSTFIPAKEILSNAWNFEAAVDKNNVDFDDTYLDIITSAKIDISRGPDSSDRKKYLEILQKITTGKVTVEKDKFYLKPGTQAKIEFNLVAEGIRKIALLWQLIKNGTLEKGAILFWDEPEANINPIHIPMLVEMLIELQRNGVQVFISTHDYILAKYFEIKKSEDDELLFYSLYEENGSAQCEKSTRFSTLNHNVVTDSFNKLLDEVYFKNYGDE